MLASLSEHQHLGYWAERGNYEMRIRTHLHCFYSWFVRGDLLRSRTASRAGQATNHPWRHRWHHRMSFGYDVTVYEIIFWYIDDITQAFIYVAYDISDAYIWHQWCHTTFHRNFFLKRWWCHNSVLWCNIIVTYYVTLLLQCWKGPVLLSLQQKVEYLFCWGNSH